MLYYESPQTAARNEPCPARANSWTSGWSAVVEAPIGAVQLIQVNNNVNIYEVNMKKRITILTICLLLAFLLAFPKEALAAAREGLGLWLDTLLPTLLPFLILTGILLRTDGITRIVQPIAPFFKVLTGLSGEGAYAFVLGLLCGYPMGAKLTADLYHAGKISRQESEYLLTFCNNPSPAFLVTYVGQICLEGKVPVGFLVGILFLSDMTCMCFFRFFVFRKKSTPVLADLESTENRAAAQGGILDSVIMNSFETMAKLGGYILMFSIISACVSHFWFLPPGGKYIFFGMIEVTTGVHRLLFSGFPFRLRVLLALCMSAFGGLCIVAQTKSVLGKDLSLRSYASAKCLNTAITAVLTLLFL